MGDYVRLGRKRIDDGLNRAQRFYQRHREKILSYAKSRRDAGIRGWTIEEQREYDLKRNYNLTTERYNELFNSQGGCCAICGIPQSELKRCLCVDHDHKTGKIRGLLCNQCNHGLGNFNDDILLLNQAKIYLKEFKDE